MEHEQSLTSVCLERLHVWVKVHCPDLLEDPEFLAGLEVICLEEVNEAVGRERQRLAGAARGPSLQ